MRPTTGSSSTTSSEGSRFGLMGDSPPIGIAGPASPLRNSAALCTYPIARSFENLLLEGSPSLATYNVSSLSQFQQKEEKLGVQLFTKA
jgi:hypothetical protein